MNTPKLNRKSPRSGKSLVGNTNGAVLVEFAVVVLPLLIIFFTSLQFAQLAVVRMVVAHAAGVASRSAAVSYAGAGGTIPNAKTDWAEDAARLAMNPWTGRGAIMPDGSYTTVKVLGDSFEDDSTKHGIVEVTVHVIYNCAVPLGRNILCKQVLTTPIEETVWFPYQSAYYE